MRSLAILAILVQGAFGWWCVWSPDYFVLDAMHLLHLSVLLVAIRLAFVKDEEGKKWSSLLALAPTGICGCWWMWVGAGLAGAITFCAGGVLWGIGSILLLKAK